MTEGPGITWSWGAWVSATVTWLEQVAEFPEASVALYVTVVVPRGKVLGPPEGLTGAAPQLSVAVAAPGATTAAPPTHSAVRSMGHTSAGGVASITSTWDMHEETWPARSTHVRVTWRLSQGVGAQRGLGAAHEISIRIGRAIVDGAARSTGRIRHQVKVLALSRGRVVNDHPPARRRARTVAVVRAIVALLSWLHHAIAAVGDEPAGRAARPHPVAGALITLLSRVQDGVTAPVQPAGGGAGSSGTPLHRAGVTFLGWLGHAVAAPHRGRAVNQDVGRAVGAVREVMEPGSRGPRGIHRDGERGEVGGRVAIERFVNGAVPVGQTGVSEIVEDRVAGDDVGVVVATHARDGERAERVEQGHQRHGSGAVVVAAQRDIHAGLASLRRREFDCIGRDG